MAESDVAIVMPEICFRISAEEVDKEVKETQEKEEVEIESEEAAAGEEAKEANQDLKRKRRGNWREPVMERMEAKGKKREKEVRPSDRKLRLRWL
ncbi:hypothetical protein FCM35_KLT18712 [Carex littledalei]|uniref:Uncharacterized protein n=1 Tax=Carex littledalei TaxID=544730 RepID=A0A833R497_9POAL|nr:hypothetical protein FCM35_KLT18712 [Carex littledalei]